MLALFLLAIQLSTSSVVTQPELELVFSDDRHLFVGVAVSASGRVFTNYPFWSNQYEHAVVEVVNGAPVPYPNLEMNSWKVGEDGTNKWV